MKKHSLIVMGLMVIVTFFFSCKKNNVELKIEFTKKSKKKIEFVVQDTVSKDILFGKYEFNYETNPITVPINCNRDYWLIIITDTSEYAKDVYFNIYYNDVIKYIVDAVICDLDTTYIYGDYNRLRYLLPKQK